MPFTSVLAWRCDGCGCVLEEKRCHVCEAFDFDKKMVERQVYTERNRLSPLWAEAVGVTKK